MAADEPEVVSRYRTQDGAEFKTLEEAYKHIARCNLSDLLMDAASYGDVPVPSAVEVLVTHADKVREWLDIIAPKEATR